MDKADQYVWYNTITESKGIRPPTEKPPSLGSFPETIQEYITKTARPIYDNLFRSERRIRIEGDPLTIEGGPINPIEYGDIRGRRK